jgi:methyl-accepting chemotaxis protein
MRLAAKLACCFTAMVCITLGIGVVGYTGISGVHDNVEEVAVVRLPSIEGLYRMQVGATDVLASNEAIMIESFDASKLAAELGKLSKAFDLFELGLKQYEPLPQTPDEARLWTAFVPVKKDWQQAAKELDTHWKSYLDAVKRNDTQTAATLLKQGSSMVVAAAPKFDAVRDQLEGLIAINNEIAANQLAASRAIFTADVWKLSIGVGIAMLLAAGMGVWFSRTLRRSFRDVSNTLCLIAKGDLTRQLDQQRKDEFGELAVHFNASIASLRSVIVEVNATSQQVAAASTEIAASAEEMAAGMTRQTQETTQTSAAVTEMSSSVGEIAAKASQTALQAKQSGELARTGGEAVANVVREIEQVNQIVGQAADIITSLGNKSEQIGRIVGVINDIADQTNLLALNAAIEAARAGEHGRGFAVVADEVRKLAERTTVATKEVSESIASIRTETQRAVGQIAEGTSKVRQSVDSASKAGAGMTSIVESSRSVTDLIQSIAAAAEEQSAATEQVSRAVQTVAAVARESASGASQASEAAGSLSSKAEQLRALIGRFKV